MSSADSPQGRGLVVIAIGGNSLIDPDNPDVPHQWEACRKTCAFLADLVERGRRLVVTHGNGPQFGFLLRRDELGSAELHRSPLDLINADTQGAIGYMLCRSLRNQLRLRGLERPVAAIVTQVLVDRQDVAFDNPTKPIGSFLEAAAAERFKEAGWQVVEDAGRGFRRVIASPLPVEIVELAVIRQLVASGSLVIACGGGGIPVYRDEQGSLAGAPAVIDKDRTSALLAGQLGAETLVISTAVPQVALRFGQPDQQWIDQMNVAEAQRHIEAGEFAVGSMLPKIEAAIQFIESGGKQAVITDPDHLGDALEGSGGTWVVRN